LQTWIRRKFMICNDMCCRSGQFARFVCGRGDVVLSEKSQEMSAIFHFEQSSLVRPSRVGLPPRIRVWPTPSARVTLNRAAFCNLRKQGVGQLAGTVGVWPTLPVDWCVWLPYFINPKSEYRNPKQIRNSKLESHSVQVSLGFRIAPPCFCSTRSRYCPVLSRPRASVRRTRAAG